MSGACNIAPLFLMGQIIVDLYQGKIVADFVNAYYDETDRIIIRCDGGISRSAGVGAAIMRVKEGSDYPIFRSRRKSPNMTCYLATLKGFCYI